MVQQAAWALGTKVSITALHASRRTADEAVTAALEEIERVERFLSLYRPDSQLCRLNRRGAIEAPHPYLVEVLLEAQAMSRQTQGAFDVTVQPLWELYAEAHRAGTRPEAAAVDDARRRVNWRRVEVSPDSVRLLGPGTAVTLNGIAQGFAADRVMAALGRFGIEHALVNTGEVAAQGNRPDGDAWTVGIQHPRREDAWIGLARLRGRCLATSGDYATLFAEDYRSNHLFDPHTGRSPEHFASVSVAARSATQADALSTAVFVLGAERGLALVRSVPGADAMLVFKDGRTLTTAGFPILDGPKKEA